MQGDNKRWHRNNQNILCLCMQDSYRLILSKHNKMGTFALLVVEPVQLPAELEILALWLAFLRLHAVGLSGLLGNLQDEGQLIGICHLLLGWGRVLIAIHGSLSTIINN